MAHHARRLSWPPILDEARAIIAESELPFTLRQLFYRLVARGVLENTRGRYKALSERTATARREGDFPDLIDLTREIHRNLGFDGPQGARKWLHGVYRRDRTEGQAVSLYIGVAKHGLVASLDAWFGDLGIPILALGGYSSETFVRHAPGHLQPGPQRRAPLAGDFDSSGEDIARDFVSRAMCFHEVVHVALTAEQVERFDLPEQMGKAGDSRGAAFALRHGRNVQVELDALAPDDLRALFQEAADVWWDDAAYEASVEREQADRDAL